VDGEALPKLTSGRGSSDREIDGQWRAKIEAAMAAAVEGKGGRGRLMWRCEAG
jgi:hypothetical protein